MTTVKHCGKYSVKTENCGVCQSNKIEYSNGFEYVYVCPVCRIKELEKETMILSHQKCRHLSIDDETEFHDCKFREFIRQIRTRVVDDFATEF